MEERAMQNEVIHNKPLKAAIAIIVLVAIIIMATGNSHPVTVSAGQKETVNAQTDASTGVSKDSNALYEVYPIEMNYAQYAEKSNSVHNTFEEQKEMYYVINTLRYSTEWSVIGPIDIDNIPAKVNPPDNVLMLQVTKKEIADNILKVTAIITAPEGIGEGEQKIYVRVVGVNGKYGGMENFGYFTKGEEFSITVPSDSPQEVQKIFFEIKANNKVGNAS